ncbi:MAG: copper chaperone PCu(A)C [Proteobacteria bacterium]|nr:copper chaperone PCu(A)C [Pseudomonadota bacterium]
MLLGGFGCGGVEQRCCKAASFTECFAVGFCASVVGMMLRIWLGLVLVLGSFGGAWAYAEEAAVRLQLEEGRVAEAAAGGSVVIEGLLVNAGVTSQTLVKFASPAAEMVLLQRVGRDAKGLAVTEVLPRLELAPRTALKLVEGLTEIRLVGLKEELVAGNEIALLLGRADGNSQVVRVSIVGPRARAALPEAILDEHGEE